MSCLRFFAVRPTAQWRRRSRDRTRMSSKQVSKILKSPGAHAHSPRAAAFFRRITGGRTPASAKRPAPARTLTYRSFRPAYGWPDHRLWPEKGGEGENWLGARAARKRKSTRDACKSEAGGFTFARACLLLRARREQSNPCLQRSVPEAGFQVQFRQMMGTLAVISSKSLSKILKPF